MSEPSPTDRIQPYASFWRRDERRRWESGVDTWEGVAASPAFQRLAATVIELADPQEDDRVVDLGAGTGLLSLAIAPRVETVIAVDYSQPMLDRLALKARSSSVHNVAAVAADLRSLPLPDESATLAVSNYAFHHLSDEAKELALGEVRRILEPGGRLVVCDMMFELSLDRRDRTLIAQKLVQIARRGPAGFARILKNAGRLAIGRWEHPASAQTWRELLERRQFTEVEVRLLEHEGGIATARRPGRGRA